MKWSVDETARLRALVGGAMDSIVSGERADRVLSRTLRANRDLPSEMRALVAAWTLGISLWRGRLDTMAGGDRSLWLGLFLVDREKRSLDEAATIAGAPESALATALKTEPPTDPVARLAFERSLPTWLAQRWIDLWGLDRADRLAAAMNTPGPIALRANLHRITPDGLIARLSSEGVIARRSRLVSSSVVAEGRPNIVALESWRAGLFEVQDEGSQLIADAVGAQPGQTVVDLCAGSGGKTLALAAAMKNEGRLVAVDIEPQRLVDLRVRARRHGVTCIETRSGDARDPSLASDLEGKADAVLVDAPCSSVGAMRRGPDSRWRLAPGDAERWASVQVALLHVGAALVAPGGRLVYATCSLDPAENEQVAKTLGIEDWGRDEERTVAPDTDGCDGFYWCSWIRKRRS